MSVMKHHAATLADACDALAELATVTGRELAEGSPVGGIYARTAATLADRIGRATEDVPPHGIAGSLEMWAGIARRLAISHAVDVPALAGRR